MQAPQPEETVRFLSPDRVSIAAARSGRGPPLVLVHGSAADHTRWRPVLPALEEHFTVHAVDRRGRGGSTDTESHDLGREADDIAAVVHTLGPGTELLGHSFGAICSLEAALRTDRIAKLVLYEPPIPTGIPIFDQAIHDEIQAAVDRGDREGGLVTFYTKVVRVPPAGLVQLRSLPAWAGRVAAAHTLTREMRAVNRYVFDADRFRNLRIPTLILAGADSPEFFHRAAEAVCAAIPGATKIVMKGQQHAAMDTGTSLFTGEVLRFLRQA